MYIKFIFCVLIFVVSLSVAFSNIVLSDSDSYRLSESIDSIKYVDSFNDFVIISSGRVFYFYLLSGISDYLGSSILALQLFQGIVLFLTSMALLSFLKSMQHSVFLAMLFVVIAMFILPFYKNIIFTTTMQAMGSVLMIFALNHLVSRKYVNFYALSILSILAHPYFLLVLPMAFVTVRLPTFKILCILNLVLPLIFIYPSKYIASVVSESPFAQFNINGYLGFYVTGFRYDFYLTIFVGVVVAVYFTKFISPCLQYSKIQNDSNTLLKPTAHKKYMILNAYISSYLTIFLSYSFVMEFPYHDRFLQSGWLLEGFVLLFILMHFLSKSVIISMPNSVNKDNRV